ncbi:MAG: hypothetical protein IPP90_23255 [Gemmatimonadaceae bacterium]|nr:hypothetical protein [Gemmatimonadaceae bacterium]
MTTAAPVSVESLPKRSVPIAEHWWLLAVFAAVVTGFWPSFFKHLRAQDLSHSLHGFTSTGWLLGLVLQSWLMATGARVWHRRVALVMIPMAVALVVTAVPMMQAMLRTGQAQPGFQPIARMLAAYDAATLLCFTGLLSVALVNVRRPTIHRRALSATALYAIPPALARFLNGPSIGLDFTVALHASFALGYLILGWLIVEDRRRNVPDRVYPFTLVSLVAIQLLMSPVSTSPWWVALTDAMSR